MSLHHFKRQFSILKTPEVTPQVEEVCSVSSNNCSNSANTINTIEIASIKVNENSNKKQQPISKIYNNDEINSIHDLRLEFNTANTLNPHVYSYNDNPKIKDKLQQ